MVDILYLNFLCQIFLALLAVLGNTAVFDCLGDRLLKIGGVDNLR